MKSHRILRGLLLLLSIFILLAAAGCSDDFYLSENEAAVYSNYLGTDTAMNQHFSVLQNQSLQLTFDPTSSTPRLLNTSLLPLMRTTDLTQLETGPAAVQLDHLSSELEKQIENWIDGRLQLYSANDNDSVRLTQISGVSVQFRSNPAFTFQPNNQSIAFDATVTLAINCTIDVHALNSILNSFLGVFGNGINGTYSFVVTVNDLHLSGNASLLSPFVDAGRIRLQLTPQPGVIRVVDYGASSAPDQVKNGVSQVLARALSSPVDEIFYQRYGYFALPRLQLTQETPSRLLVAYSSRPESASPALHVVSRASDGRLYHARRNSNSWSDFNAVPFPTPQARLDNDPTLVHSGGGQLELAATDASFNFVYAHWRDEAWGNWKTITPANVSPTMTGFKGKPAVVATAPGQLEIVAEGRDGNLWYLRRWNGNWFVPYIIQLNSYSKILSPPFRDPAAVQVGNKIVVAFVDGKNQLCAIAYDLETNFWTPPLAVKTAERINFAPAAAASASGHVDIAYVGQSGATYDISIAIDMARNIVSGPPTSGIITPGSETNLGGKLNDSPALVASGFGSGQLDLIGNGAGNRLYHNRFGAGVSPMPGWSGWSLIKGGLFSPATIEGIVDSFAVTATRSGEVELAAHNGAQLLFDNKFLTSRFFAPQKTVGWRGYQLIGGYKVVGKPALAAVDRNFELSIVGGQTSLGPQVDAGVLPDSDRTAFTGVDPTVVQYNPPSDPVTLSTGPNISDFLVLGKNGKLRHTRLFTDGFGMSASPLMPAGVTFSSPLSAVSYGNGQIELVAVASNQVIYHWRYRNDAWSTPTAVPGSAGSAVSGGIISAPSLSHVGAAQLELLAINNDRQLVRWRFTNGSWDGGQRVAASFSINPLLFGSTAVSSWGDGTIDVVVVDAQTKTLYQRRIGPGDESCSGLNCPAPRVFNSLGGSAIDTPALTALSPTRLNVLAMGTDHAYYSSWSSQSTLQPVTIPPRRDLQLSWSAYESIGGAGLFGIQAANAGRRNLALVAINQQGRLFVNRNLEGHWSGFQTVIGQTPQMQISAPLFFPSLAAHGG